MLNFLIAGLPVSPTCIRRNHLGFLHRSASSIFNSFSSEAVKSSESAHPKQNQVGNESFTVSYLINSCGLYPKAAIQVSKNITLKDPEKPNTVLDLFRSYGFSETQISKLVKNRPQLLLANSETIILPKLRFFQSIGLSTSELAELLLSNPALLSRSLEKFLVPVYEALKSVIDDDDIVLTAIKRSKSRFHCFHVQDFVANLRVLREHGVPQSSVSMILTQFTGVAFTKHAKFVECVEFAKEIGIEPVKATFIMAIFVMSSTKKSTWESKLDMFERCGMPRDITFSAFSNYPICMLKSEKKIMNSMKFLLNEMRMPLKDIARSAALLGYSLETRMIPRWSVFRLLRTKGLIKRDKSFYSIVSLSEKKFLEKFVFSFEESVPQILSIYKGQLGTLPEVGPM